MLKIMISFLTSWFQSPNLLGIGLAIAFGVVWLLAYWPPLFKRHWLWAVLVSSAFLTLLAVTFIQIPLQALVGQAYSSWNREVVMGWILLTGIPQILLSGLVQEGAKMVPMVVWWGFKQRNITPRLGLTIGAIAGFGFGVFEAVWAHNQIFASGWTLAAVQTSGLVALAGFWERFFAVAFHIAASSLAGYGLARGRGWQFYLIASFAHGVLNYGVVVLQKGIFNIIQLELYAAVIAVLVTAAALWLRWRKTVEEQEPVASSD